MGPGQEAQISPKGVRGSKVLFQSAADLGEVQECHKTGVAILSYAMRQVAEKDDVDPDKAARQ